MSSSGPRLAYCSSTIPDAVSYGSTYLLKGQRPMVNCNVNGTLTKARHGLSPDCTGDWSSCRDACLYEEQQYGACTAFGFDSAATYASASNREGGDCYFYRKGPQANGLVKDKTSTRGFYNNQCFDFHSCNKSDPGCAAGTPYYIDCGLERGDDATSSQNFDGSLAVCDVVGQCEGAADAYTTQNPSASVTSFVLSLIKSTNEWRCQLYGTGTDDSSHFDMANADVQSVYAYEYTPLTTQCSATHPGCSSETPYYTGCGYTTSAPYAGGQTGSYTSECDAIDACASLGGALAPMGGTMYVVSYLGSNSYRCNVYNDANAAFNTADSTVLEAWAYNIGT